MGYEAPIQMQMGEIIRRAREEQDKKIYEAVLECGINVSKEELVKALNYDRQQYEKGYVNGKVDADFQLLELEEMDEVIKKLHSFLLKNKVTIRATSGADLLITDEETGEERVLPDLGFPF